MNEARARRQAEDLERLVQGAISRAFCNVSDTEICDALDKERELTLALEPASLFNRLTGLTITGADVSQVESNHTFQTFKAKLAHNKIAIDSLAVKQGWVMFEDVWPAEVQLGLKAAP